VKSLLVFAAIAEASTGLALLLLPSLVGQWLFGAGLTGIAVTLARFAGIALVALAVACWPGKPRLAMLGYGARPARCTSPTSGSLAARAVCCCGRRSCCISY
jgi:hypothetical protein